MKINYIKKRQLPKNVLKYLQLTCTGQLWDSISKEEGLPREEVKIDMFKQVFYSNTEKAYPWKRLAKKFKKRFPTVYKIIGRWKRKKKRPQDIEDYISKYGLRPNKSTAALAIAMQNLESRIMITILKRMYAKGWYAINLHDCIIVPDVANLEMPSVDQVKSVMNDVYREYGLMATFK